MPTRPDEIDEEEQDSRRLRKKWNIYFWRQYGTFRWPEWCRKYVEDINQVISTRYDGYAASVDEHQPWTRGNLSRAEELANFAQKCIRDQVNEETWRYRLEGRVFFRFEKEVAW